MSETEHKTGKLTPCTIHGMVGTPTYKSWGCMKERCLSPNHKSYEIYKKVQICDRWVNSFKLFFADMGVRPAGTTLDRIDNEKGYSPDNCRWATREQQANNRSNSRFVECNGKIMTISQWAEEKNMGRDTLRLRLNSGWSVNDSLNRPVRNQKNSRALKLN